MQADGTFDGERLTERQKDVLDAALRLLVEEGDNLTMAAVARRASCSKESLYKWFGDRDGLLNATVRWQASKVRVAPVDQGKVDLISLTESLEGFARDWLKVISSDTSIALNRVAISHAGSGRDNLGAIVLDNGRFALAKRLKPVLDAGKRSGVLVFEDAETAFRTFFGLVARDVQIRLLLGNWPGMTEAAIAEDAARATRQFLALYGARKTQ
ncbi:TetR family transcriptional regulator [Mesorhizobium sp. Root552]|uniref:TetR/AcrR family transcriptional regulator n=1 Tax=Mesorhizobium sp. Root552 TaxID=1736555 RepID=UPI0006FF7FBA|nr:TetR/AcrR family transcriptional regulator [Mesorhizobium sp. Root552]KQZ19111.1 TetR family transcriptional regulator [Mesorhizobium sp. Root552]